MWGLCSGPMHFLFFKKSSSFLAGRCFPDGQFIGKWGEGVKDLTGNTQSFISLPTLPPLLFKNLLAMIHSMWDLGSLFPDQGSNTHSLHKECRILTTGPPRSSIFSFHFHPLSYLHFQDPNSSWFFKVNILPVPCSYDPLPCLLFQSPLLHLFLFPRNRLKSLMHGQLPSCWLHLEKKKSFFFFYIISHILEGRRDRYIDMQPSGSGSPWYF